MNDPIAAIRDSYHKTTMPKQRLEAILADLPVDTPPPDPEPGSGTNGTPPWIHLGLIGLLGLVVLYAVMTSVRPADEEPADPATVHQPDDGKDDERVPDKDIESAKIYEDNVDSNPDQQGADSPISTNRVVETKSPPEPKEPAFWIPPEPKETAFWIPSSVLPKPVPVTIGNEPRTAMGSPSGAVGKIPAWLNRASAPSDDPRFTITIDNVEEHVENLTEGQLGMFLRYPETWKMVVYPTHRTATLPPHIYSNSQRNEKLARLVNNGNGLTGALPGVAFPNPANGNEAIWNHLFRYRGTSMDRVIGQAAPTASGKYTVVRIQERTRWHYGLEGPLLAKHAKLVTAPARLAGDKSLIYETLDQSQKPRDAWRYNKGLRKTIRAPNVAFDFPRTAADGQATVDNIDMFSGSPERFIWTLSGPFEIYVPYNAHRIDRAKAEDLLRAGHINPEFGRYELHRVWKVDGRLKHDADHIYSRRTCYLDEDSWQILHVDHYDKFGQIWRVGEAHSKNDGAFTRNRLECLYDLKNGRYFVYGLYAGRKDKVDLPLNEASWSPAALKNLH